MAAAVYPAQADQSCSPLTVVPDLQLVIPAVSQPYISAGVYSYKGYSGVERSETLTVIQFIVGNGSIIPLYIVFNGEHCLAVLIVFISQRLPNYHTSEKLYIGRG